MMTSFHLTYPRDGAPLACNCTIGRDHDVGEPAAELAKIDDVLEIVVRGVDGRAVVLPDEDPCVDGEVLVFMRVFDGDPYLRPYLYAAVRVNGIYWLTQRGVGGQTAVPARRWVKLVEWLGTDCLGMVRMRPEEIIIERREER